MPFLKKLIFITPKNYKKKFYRNIPDTHIPKRHYDPEDTSPPPNVERNNTKVRILGTELETPFNLENKRYGRFNRPELKYMKTGIKDKMFEEFFQSHLDKEKEEQKELDKKISNLRMFETTKRDNVIPQTCDYTSLGRRQMLTQNLYKIPVERLDKLFMANHESSKYPSIIPFKTTEEYPEKYIPYSKDKEITFWSMNSQKSNMYRSNQTGINSFAKSSGFTQPLANVRSAEQYHGNTTTNIAAKNIYLDDNDVEFAEEYKAYKETIVIIP